MGLMGFCGGRDGMFVPHGSIGMKKTSLALAVSALLGAFTLGAGCASAAPIAVNGLHADQSGITQVRMMRGDRMMMKKRMMRKRMMKRRMMKRM